MESKLWTVAEVTAHRAALLAGYRNNELVSNVNRLVLYFLNTFCVSKKVCLDVIFFSIITDIKVFDIQVSIRYDFAGMCFCDFSYMYISLKNMKTKSFCSFVL